MSKPVAVLIADVHYSINTLSLADAATRQAIDTANDLKVPLIVAGDLHDTKSFHRAECQEAMLKTFAEARTPPIVLVGNHCRRNERSPEHALHFLQGVADIVGHPVTWDSGTLHATLIPYQSSREEFNEILRRTKGIPVICHQGLVGAEMGHYVQDKSAITKEDVIDYRVISGHYHRRQDIECGRPRERTVGFFSYIGNPYTLTFGEAKDPEKGYQVLMDDGTLEFFPTNLRKHIIKEFRASELSSHIMPFGELFANQDDLLWIKVTGPRSELVPITKKSLEPFLVPGIDFRLDKIPTDDHTPASQVEKMTSTEAMDSVIESTQETAEQKAELKRLYRELLG